VVVEGINTVKKHSKPNPLKGTTGGVVAKKPCQFISPTSLSSMRRSGKADRVLASSCWLMVSACASYKSSGDEIKAA
jgi:large subunit ribosomal protein L24